MWQFHEAMQKLQLLAVSRPGHVVSVQDYSLADINAVNPQVSMEEQQVD